MSTPTEAVSVVYEFVCIIRYVLMLIVLIHLLSYTKTVLRTSPRCYRAVYLSLQKRGWYGTIKKGLQHLIT